MKLKNLFYTLLIIFSPQLLAQNTNPVVSNIRHSYGNGVVTISYDVADAEQTSVTISMKVSDNSGADYTYSCSNISGDVGENVSVGNRKVIVWEHDAEHGGPPVGENFIIKIIANDEVEGTESCGKVYYEGGPNNDGGGDYYNTIQIGDQCWLKENLNAGMKINSNNANDNQTNNGIIEKYCYNNDESNCDAYGGLYQWKEALQYVLDEGTQGICPTGWHVPTIGEFQILADAANQSSNSLKAIGEGIDDGVGTNTSGFSALLVGFREDDDGSFKNLTYNCRFWSSTDYTTAHARRMLLIYNNDDISLSDNNKNNGFSVRCLKNQTK